MYPFMSSAAKVLMVIVPPLPGVKVALPKPISMGTHSSSSFKAEGEGRRSESFRTPRVTDWRAALARTPSPTARSERRRDAKAPPAGDPDSAQREMADTL